MERKEAIEVIKKNWPDSSFTRLREALETLIPELVGSEDERIRGAIIDYLKDNNLTEWAAWLEKQGEQKPADTEKGANGNEREIPNSAWSEEDEEKMVSIFLGIETFCPSIIYGNGKEEVLNWFKSLKDRVQPQPKQEWSEMDESMLYGVMETEQYMLDVVNGIEKFDVGNGAIRKACTEELNWLKSLRPQSHWKPSDEQMKYLAKAITTLGNEGDNKTSAILYELRTDLKKLKG